MKLAPLLLLLATPAAVLAQDGNRAARFEAQMEQRFAAADANSDGKLTRDEAKAGMPRVYQQFDAIDGTHKGYVTLDDIRATLQTRMAARGAGRGAAGSGGAE